MGDTSHDRIWCTIYGFFPTQTTLIGFWGDEVEAIHSIHPSTKLTEEQDIVIFPANLFVTSKEVIEQALNQIQPNLIAQIQFFEAQLWRSQAHQWHNSSLI